MDIVIMELSDYLSVIAIVIASISAVYAHFALRESRMANKISLHSRQKEIYDSFLVLKNNISHKHEQVEQKYISQFRKPAADAKLYFPEQIAMDINNYYKKCFSVTDVTGSVSDEMRSMLVARSHAADKIGTDLNAKLIAFLALSKSI